MLNKKDELLIRELERDAKLSSRKLAMKTGIPISTVHRRIKALEKEGIIKRYKAVIDYQKTDTPTALLILINIEEKSESGTYTPVDKIKDSLSKLTEVYEILDIRGGEWDLILKARLLSLQESTSLLDRIRQIDGIEEVSSIVVTEERVL